MLPFFADPQHTKGRSMNIHSYTAPSGRTLTRNDLFLIRAMERNKTIEWSDEEVTFNSGFKSHVYLRARNDLSHNLYLLNSIAARIKEVVFSLEHTHGPQWCLIGIPTAGTQLAQATASLTYDISYGRSAICFSTMRSVLKTHGKDSMWVGPPQLERHTPVTVENVVSTAKAYLEHLDHLEQDGYPTRVMHHIAFADWELGGADTLRGAAYKLHTMYLVRDMLAALVQMDIWPRERYQEMDRRVNRWRADNVRSAA